MDIKTLFFKNSFSFIKKKITVSTWLTILRIIMTPIIVISMVYEYWEVAFPLFVVAGITDFLDGALARLFSQQTFLGACLDPIADKFLLISCFATLAFVRSPVFSIPLWFVILVLIRDFTILSGACFIFYKQGFLKIRPTFLGKATTMVQICFIAWLFACYFFEWAPVKTYYTMLGLLFLLVSFSLSQYIIIGIKQLNKKSS